jgi:hypothetical protein
VPTLALETSILKSTKKILGIADDYTVYDQDIMVHINSVFSTLEQLGIGPDDGFMIDDDTATWDAFYGTDKPYNAVQTYVYLRVRRLFDPPATSFHLEALDQQIKELEWRLNVHREGREWVDPDPDPVEEP